ncbi:alpha-amylase family glycosyl hydrolase [Daejeonella oryzae]|uniref:alpha-amylase family glycosyl hydrolase n=1 Tax=Daejeonella oryzae TaxID=1122943 RepID=UPI00047D7CEF|nr:alpha-amylase family glycosyl hydrolase [Daejeonella oryzae]
MRTRLLLIILFLITSFHLKAQLITLSPDFPTETSTLTLTFDASKGSGGLNNFTGDVYIHTGVITDKSTSPADWKYVKHPWATVFSDIKMTPKGNNLFEIIITNPRSYYAVPSGEKILKLAMVFRNADGTREAKNSDNSDIYASVYPEGVLAVKFKSPQPEPKFNPIPATISKKLGESLDVTAVSSSASNLSLTLNDIQFASASSSTTINGNVMISTTGKQVIKITGNNGTSAVTDSFSFVVNSAVQNAELPAGAKDGVTYLNNGTSVLFNLLAPLKSNVYVIGDFNNWQPSPEGFMKNTPDGKRWWVQIDNLTAGTEYAYQFLVDGNLRIADPYCEKILDPNNDQYISNYPALKAYPSGKTTGIVSVLQSNSTPYSWNINNFSRPKKTDLVIYELHLRDFLAAHNYQTLIDTLGYLQNLGINAIEMMPVNEFEGNESWGYNPSFYFAPDKYYGPKNELKAFIDEAHKRGMSVILDMVLNHSFGQSPMVELYFDNATGKPSLNSPWFNRDATHPFNVGYDFNHESAETKYFSKKVMEFWLKEYKIDGYRFDLSKGFTQKNNPNNVGAWGNFDQSRIDIWKDYYDFITSVDAGALVILEHFADNSEEKVLSDYGMMLWGNMNHSYNEASMGYLPESNFSGGIYSERGWTKPNLITYMESHDEERLMFKNIQFGNSSANYSVKDPATALKRQELVAAFFLTLPGPKMIWQFGERGYDLSINYPSGTSNDRLSNKPPRWEYMNEPNRKQLYNVYSKLIKLRTAHDAFENTNFTYSLAGGIKTIHLNDAAVNITIVGNFDVTPQTSVVNFSNTGKWYDYLTQDSINVTNTAFSMSMQPGEYHVYTSKNLNASNGLPVVDSEPDVNKEGDYFFNFPNPVNDETTIAYKLLKSSQVTIKLYNFMGKEVQTLLDSKQQSEGEHQLKWNLNNGSKITTGVYFLKLQSDNQTRIQKIIVNN